MVLSVPPKASFAPSGENDAPNKVSAVSRMERSSLRWATSHSSTSPKVAGVPPTAAITDPSAEKASEVILSEMPGSRAGPVALVQQHLAVTRDREQAPVRRIG